MALRQMACGICEVFSAPTPPLTPAMHGREEKAGALKQRNRRQSPHANP